jgi:hypothetical protein
MTGCSSLISSIWMGFGSTSPSEHIFFSDFINSFGFECLLRGEGSFTGLFSYLTKFGWSSSLISGDPYNYFRENLNSSSESYPPNFMLFRDSLIDSFYISLFEFFADFLTTESSNIRLLSISASSSIANGCGYFAISSPFSMSNWRLNYTKTNLRKPSSTWNFFSSYSLYIPLLNSKKMNSLSL